MDKQVIRTIPHEAISDLLPEDARIVIEHLCIGSEKQYYSYNEGVSTTSTGYVSGGGTRTSSYLSFDFGFAVVNTSSVNMRVQFSLTEIDKDDYTINNWHTWEDIAPGEKRRLWNNLFMTEAIQFKSYLIKEIGVGPTPPEGKKGFATWTAMTTPNKSLFDIFNLSKNPLPKSKRSSTGCFGIALTLFVIGFLLLLILK